MAIPTIRGPTSSRIPAFTPVATEDAGTYDRPGTLASDKRLIAAGTVVYIPALQRYYVMEDTCRECIRNWSNDKAHVDVVFVSGTESHSSRASTAP